MRSSLCALALLVASGAAGACGGGRSGDAADADTAGDSDIVADDLQPDDMLPDVGDVQPLDAATELGVFDPAITDVTLEIDYETNEEPFTGPILAMGDTFDTTVTNLDRLFARHKTLHIPRTVGAMENIGTVPDEQLTVADLLALADAHRDQLDTATSKSYYLLFVSGQFTDATGPKPNILGVSLGNTGVIAMFKDAIRTTAQVGMPNVVRYVEQSTIVHETAHAIGLVNNGIPLRSAHQDSAHGAHCTNDHCVMYYLNEGASDATQFALTYVLSGSTILFDAACLADADALTGGL